MSPARCLCAIPVTWCVWLRLTSLARRFASLKRTNCNNTGGWVRTNDLGIMSPARFPCATPVSGVWLCLTSLARRFDSVKRTNCNNTGDPFRSGVLKVMSLARFLCATPVTGCVWLCLTSLSYDGSIL